MSFEIHSLSCGYLAPISDGSSHHLRRSRRKNINIRYTDLNMANLLLEDMNCYCIKLAMGTGADDPLHRLQRSARRCIEAAREA